MPNPRSNRDGVLNKGYTMTQATATTVLFDKLGQRTAIETMVNEFFKRVLGDRELNPYFADTDMDQTKMHFTDFISMSSGGPKQYTGRTMKNAHGDLGITGQHFDLFAGHLVAALKWAGVAKDDIDQVMAKVTPLKGDVVTA